VCDFSRSTKNSLITKQELFHHILANNLEIEETGNDGQCNNFNLFLCLIFQVVLIMLHSFSPVT
jgi:hypothetical protein